MVSGLGPEDAPTPGCWGLRQWARESATNRSSFINVLWKMTIPSRSQVEMEASFSDDGKAQLALIDKLLPAVSAVARGLPGGGGGQETKKKGSDNGACKKSVCGPAIDRCEGSRDDGPGQHEGDVRDDEP